MDRRERVLRAIRHEPTDFVPYQFHAVPAVRQRVRERYGLQSDIELDEFVGNHLWKLGSDFNRDPFNPDQPPEACRDEFGCVWDIRRGDMGHPIAHPLLGPSLKGYRFPDPEREGRLERQLADLEHYRQRVFVFGKLGMSLFERAWSLRGFQELLIDMLAEPAFVEDLMDRILEEWNLPMVDRIASMGVDGFYFGDDWGTQAGLLFSPSLWRRFIKPRAGRMYDRARSHGLVVGIHSCGQVQPLLADLVSMGVDVLNPVQPEVMDVEAVKAEFGDRLCLYGGISTERTLPAGTPEDVRREILDRARVLGDGGGYILQSAHVIQDDVPDPNVFAYIDTVRSMAGLG